MGGCSYGITRADYAESNIKTTQKENYWNYLAMLPLGAMVLAGEYLTPIIHGHDHKEFQKNRQKAKYVFCLNLGKIIMSKNLIKKSTSKLESLGYEVREEHK